MNFHNATTTRDTLQPQQNLSRYVPFMQLMPVISEAKDANVHMAEWVMSSFASAVTHDEALMNVDPGEGKFERSVVVAEPPMIVGNGSLHRGAELVVGHWGEGFRTPIHAHIDGWQYGKLITGRHLEENFRQPDPRYPILRQTAAYLFEQGDRMEESFDTLEHPAIHRVTVLKPSTSVHFFPVQRTGTGFPNYSIEYFEDYYSLGWQDVSPIVFERYMSLKPGSVVLVRSPRVPELGDHFIVITGEPIQKRWGVRPQSDILLAPGENAKNLLDIFGDGDSAYGSSEYYGATLLQLTPEAERNFKLFHNIH